MIEIIGAGQPRTGTRTLQKALEILGYGPCYHMFTLLRERPEEVRYFADARDGRPVAWQELFSKYRSAVDFPASLYYRSILDAYPDAKLILTVRDSEGWYRSISETVFKASQPTPLKMAVTLLRLPFSSMVRRRMPVLAFAGRMIKSFYGPDLRNKASVIRKFEVWNEDVIASFPPNKLLVFDVREGWGPLCSFLNVPVPAVEFPKTNSTKEFKEHTARL